MLSGIYDILVSDISRTFSEVFRKGGKLSIEDFDRSIFSINLQNFISVGSWVNSEFIKLTSWRFFKFFIDFGGFSPCFKHFKYFIFLQSPMLYGNSFKPETRKYSKFWHFPIDEGRVYKLLELTKNYFKLVQLPIDSGMLERWVSCKKSFWRLTS